MKRYKNLLLITATLILSNFCYGQSEEDTTLKLTFNQAIDTFFREIMMDTLKIPTKILIDRAPTLVQRELMDGKHPEYIVNRDSVLELYSELYYGHFNYKTLLNVDTLEDIVEAWKKQNPNIIPLMLVYSNHHKIKTDAFANRWLVVDSLNMLIQDVSPSGETAFEAKTAFAATPLVSSIAGFSATFMLPSQFVFSNTTYDQLLIDVGNGQGFRSLQVNQPISLSFSDNSNALITIQAIKGNDTLTSISTVSLPSSISLNSVIEVPDSFPLYVNGKTHWYGIWWSCDNAAKCIKKPIIIVEGYDPSNKRFLYVPGAPSYPTVTKKNSWDENLYAVGNNPIPVEDNMRNEGYDIVILNFADGLDRLEDQAEVVKALIRELKNKIAACGSNNQFVILGPSSGGLITRYALADMEGNGEDHNTRLYISFDAPHQGANMPLADQHEVIFLKNTVPISLLTGIKELKKIFFATPTRQLLVYYVQATNHYQALPDPEFNNFYTKLHGLNNGYGYPLKCRNIAISDGSGLAGSQGFNAGDKLFTINRTWILLNIFTDGWSVPNLPASKQAVFFGYAFIVLPLWFPPFHISIPINITRARVDNTNPYDNAPGGRGDFTELLATNIPALHDNNNDCKVTNDCRTQREDFIPTISALDLKNTTNLFYNVESGITGNDGIAYKGIDYTSAVSPFDAIFVSASNQPHVIGGLTQEIADFICSEVMADNMFLQDKIVSTPAGFEAFKTITSGSNVTNIIPPGDFVVANTGQVNIRAGELISLEPGTHLIPQPTGNVHVYVNPYPSGCTATCRLADNHVSNNIPPSLSTSGIKEIKRPEKNISVHCFPNPCIDHIHIDYSVKEASSVSIFVFNASGMKVIELLNNNNQPSGNFTTTLDTRQLPSGIYCISVQINDQIEIVKVVKTQ